LWLYFQLNVRTFPDAVKEFILAPVIMILMKMPSFLPKPKTILHKFDGAAKAGEMVLVLGRPGSGCSTFLKVIANERIGFLHVNGDVSYSGIQPKEIKKTYRGEVCYNQEDDLHQATLTVAQTLRFALKTKTPGKRLPEETKKSFRENVLDMLLKMYNITHTR
jgi:ATP-binding cassette subfamily G (WHITE) protein 2 (SNQ2)